MSVFHHFQRNGFFISPAIINKSGLVLILCPCVDRTMILEPWEIPTEQLSQSSLQEVLQNIGFMETRAHALSLLFADSQESLLELLMNHYKQITTLDEVGLTEEICNRYRAFPEMAQYALQVIITNYRERPRTIFY